MKVLRSPVSVSRVVRGVVASGQTVALVPTMGFLHEGHLALVDRARQEADFVIVSIFVNPTQFGPKDDLAAYPRSSRRDLRLLAERGADLVFKPRLTDIYPADFQTSVNVECLTGALEGKHRPGHFRGVTTVVAKLYNICRPDYVVFGQKDFQQAAVLRRMTADLGYSLKFIVAPTVRSKAGLALSSRNSYFNAEQLTEAVCLYKGLALARRAFRAGETSGAELKKIARREIRRVCRTSQIQYLELTDPKNLKPLKVAKRGAVISTAAIVHRVRLIDNIIL